MEWPSPLQITQEVRWVSAPVSTLWKENSLAPDASKVPGHYTNRAASLPEGGNRWGKKIKERRKEISRNIKRGKRGGKEGRKVCGFLVLICHSTWLPIVSRTRSQPERGYVTFWHTDKPKLSLCLRHCESYYVYTVPYDLGNCVRLRCATWNITRPPH
jgi:hypothetical protein